MQDPVIVTDESNRPDLVEAVQQLPHPVALPPTAQVRLVPIKNLSLGELKDRARVLVKKVRTGDATAKRALAQLDAGQSSRANTIRERDFHHRVLANVGNTLAFGLITHEMAADSQKALPGLQRKLKTLPRGDRSLRRLVQRENERASRALARLSSA